MNWFKKKAVESEFERRSVPGVPSVFTGRDTTIGEQRRMARDMAERDWRTPAEKGLAISLLAVIDLLEQETARAEAS